MTGHVPFFTGSCQILERLNCCISTFENFESMERLSDYKYRVALNLTALSRQQHVQRCTRTPCQKTVSEFETKRPVSGNPKLNVSGLTCNNSVPLKTDKEHDHNSGVLFSATRGRFESRISTTCCAENCEPHTFNFVVLINSISN